MKTSIYTTYAPSTDITFIMKDVFTADGDPVSTEVVGWYFGGEDEEATTEFIGKLKAEF